MARFGTLDVIIPDGRPHSHALETMSISIGRYDGNRIVIDDRSISRYHCLIQYEAGKVYIQDSASRNGTYVDGRKLEPNEKFVLSGGEYILVGRVHLHYTQAPQLSQHQAKTVRRTKRRNIFVSYRKSDKDVVYPLVERVRQWETLVSSVWIDLHLRGGQNWWDVILREIRRADIILVAVSDDYMDSVPCQREYDYATALGKAMIPVKVSADLDYYRLRQNLSTIQMIDVYDNRDAGYRELKDAIRLQETSSPLPDPLPKPPTAPLPALVEVEELAHKSTISATEADRIFRLLHSILHNKTHADDESAINTINNLLARRDIAQGFAEELKTLKDQHEQPADWLSRIWRRK